jgi:hypothetical protein
MRIRIKILEPLSRHALNKIKTPGAVPTFIRKPLHNPPTLHANEASGHSAEVAASDTKAKRETERIRLAFLIHFGDFTAMRAILLSLCAIIVCFCSGCVVRRTVTEDGGVVSQKYVVKTPFKDD